MDLTERFISRSKRKKDAKKGVAMPGGRYPIENAKDLKNAKRAIGRTPPSGRAAVRAHIRKRAKALGISTKESIQNLDTMILNVLVEAAGDKNWVADDNPYTPKSGVYGVLKPRLNANSGSLWGSEAKLDKEIKHIVTTTFPGPDDTQPIKADETQPVKKISNIVKITHGQEPAGPFTFKEKVHSPAEQAALRAAQEKTRK